MRHILFFNNVKNVTVEYLVFGFRVYTSTVVTFMLLTMSSFLLAQVNIVLAIAVFLGGLFVIAWWVTYLYRIDKNNIFTDFAHLAMLRDSIRYKSYTNFDHSDSEDIFIDGVYRN